MTPRRVARYVVARNHSGRPTLCHRVSTASASLTGCGADIRGWSRAYSAEPIEVIYCRRCAKTEGH